MLDFIGNIKMMKDGDDFIKNGLFIKGGFRFIFKSKILVLGYL